MKCDVCRGHKKVRGLGMMMRECEACTGIGYITLGTADVPPHRADEPDESFIVKKRGRKPKGENVDGKSDS